MDSRQRVLAAAARRQPDRVPFCIRLTPHIEQRLREERGIENLEDHAGMDLRFVRYCAVPEEIDHSAYTADYPPDAKVDLWGEGVRPVGFFHFAQGLHPMAAFTSAEQVAEYPLPVFEPVFDEMRRQVQAIQSRGLAAVSSYECGTLEQANHLMGMENVFTNMHLNPDMMRLLLDRICEVKARKAAAFVEAGVDLLWIGDDVGSQHGPLLSPAMWREFLLPPLKRIIASARAVRPDVPIAYHSCGSIGFAVEGLIEAGVDVLESVQPEANDPADLKAQYGDRLAFWGGAGSQSTMSHGSPDDVRAEVKHLMETVGRGGGFILAPAHRIEPECPLENIDAFLEAVEQYGYYR